MKKVKQVFYVNGKFRLPEKATISVFDIGLLRGYGVFDFMVTYNNKPFLLADHVNRLFKSAALIDLKIGKTKKEIENIILKTLKKNNWEGEKSIRIVVTGGIGNSSTEPSQKSSIIVIVEPKHNYPDCYYEKGVAVITYDYIRPLAQSKSLDYAVAIKSLQMSRRVGCVETIYIDNKTKTVSEATTSNVFIVKKGKIFTSGNNILDGVTRNIVLKLLKGKYPLHVREIKLTELFSADEIFMTASNKEIMPVVKIDNKTIGTGEVGMTTKNVMDIFRNFIEEGQW